MGGKEQEESAGKRYPVHGKDGSFALKVEEKILISWGIFTH